MATTHANLGALYSETGRIEQAFEHYDAAERLYRAAAPDGQVALAQLLANRALSLLDAGRTLDAEASMREALAIFEREQPGDHEDIAYACKELSAILTRMGKHDEAIALAERAVGISVRRAPQSVDSMRAYGALALALSVAERYDEANEATDRALAIGRLHEGNRYVRNLRYNRAVRASDAGDDEFAVAEFERLLRSDIDDDPLLLGLTCARLANALVDLDRGEEARAHAERAVAVLEKQFGCLHPYLSLAYFALGNAAALDDPDRAKVAYERAIQVLDRAWPQGHTSTATAERSLGKLLARGGRFDDAAPHLRRAAAILEQHYGARDWHTAQLHSELGACLRARDPSSPEGLKLVTEAAATMRALLGDDDERTKAAIARLPR